ncbi:MAG: ATP-binding protein, partial [Balneolaceae bacterium]|nr:ATP-binding protein [Balneolaceae bacterium]
KVIISVEDTGVGIPEDELSGIFSSESTIQQKVGTQGEKGIGMGLKLCKEFIDKHEEKIWVESTPRKGSTFLFSLKKAPEYQESQVDKSLD